MAIVGQYPRTHHVPMPLQRKLIEAKEWADQHNDAMRRPEDWRDSDARAAAILMEVVEMVEAAWGFEPPTT